MDLVYLLLSFVAAHLLVDFVGAAENSEERPSLTSWSQLIIHALSHGLVFWVLTGWGAAWPLALFLAAVHFVIDGLEPRWAETGLRPFLLSQAIHLSLGLAGIVGGLALMPSVFSSWWLHLIGMRATQLLILLSGAISAVYIGAEVVGGLVTPLRPQFEPRPDRPATAQGDRSDRRDRGFPRGGRLIGMLERALIFLLVVIGQTAGIGFLVAAKSIFRFGELRQRNNRLEAEYILIGTLASFLWGLFIAVVTIQIIKLF